MSKKKSSRPSAARRIAPSPADLAKKLADLDRRILKLCNERAKLVQRHMSPDELSQQFDIRQGKNWLQLIRQSAPIPAGAVQAIFRELDSASRALVRATRVAYLGPEFSYSHLAAIERFGQSGELVPVTSIGAVFEAVNRGDVQFGLVPIENSTDGRIVDTLDMFAKIPVKVCGEVPMRIHHFLLGRCDLASVREVHSKPQALSQCREWLSRHLPKARMQATASTSTAAESALKKSGVAAIASKQAGINYDLQVIAANIEDNPNNLTRFAVIGTEAAPRTGSDKTSLMFELTHQPGALADAMVVFKRSRLNLTWIESFPKQGSANEYLFFVELEGHPADLLVRRAIRALEKKTVRIEVLGSYARSEPVG